MGLRKLSEQNVRKLQATGENGESYAITLPKELIKQLKWRKGQKLSVTREGKKLIVQDWKKRDTLTASFLNRIKDI